MIGPIPSWQHGFILSGTRQRPCTVLSQGRAPPGPTSYSAVRCGQAASERMILWPGPSTRAQPARAEPLPVQSIKKPQLDLHSRLHNLGTYRVKAPGRDPLRRPGRKEQAMTPLVADQPPGAGDTGKRSGVKARLTPNRRRRRVENDKYASFARRVMRGYAKRVAAGDIDALADMTGSPPSRTRRSPRLSPTCGQPGTRGPRSRSGSTLPGRRHSSAGAARRDQRTSGACPRGVPEPPSPASDCHRQ